MEREVPERRAGRRARWKKRGRRGDDRARAAGSARSGFRGCGRGRAGGLGRARGSPRRAPERGARARGAVLRGGRRVSPAEGSRSWTRRRPRRGASGRAGALLPSRQPADRGTAGPQRPDLSPGRVPGRRGDAPRPRLLLGPTAPSTLGPPPPRAARRRHPRPAPGASPGPALPCRSRGACARRAGGYLGLAGPRPGLREPEECMAGGRRRRRGPAPLRLRRGRRPVPRSAETRSPGLGRVRRAGEEGRREEAAGVGTAAQPPPERPLMKARSRRRPRAGCRSSAGRGPRGCLAQGRDPAEPGPGGSAARGLLWSSLSESRFSAQTADFHC